MLKAKLTSLLQDFTDLLTLRFLNAQVLLIILMIDSWTIYLFVVHSNNLSVAQSVSTVVYFMVIVNNELEGKGNK
jgi:hypothetical protein